MSKAHAEPNWSSLLEQIPSRVKITNKVTYEILFVSSFKNPNQQGESRYKSKQILLKLTQDYRELIHTYLHELIHVFSYEYHVHLTEPEVRALELAAPFLLKKGNIFR